MKRKKHKIVRYIRVSRKKARRLNRKKVLRWLSDNLKSHPLILGMIFLFWVRYLVSLVLTPRGWREAALLAFKLHLGLAAAWLVMVVISNSLRDRQKVKWYFKKRFVFAMLVLFSPLGLILLWLGAQFQKRSKIILTVIFAGFFLVSSVYQEKRQQKFLRMSPVERVAALAAKQKRKVFLPQAEKEALAGFKFARLGGRQKDKLAVSQIYSRYAAGTVSIKTKDKSGGELGLGSGFVLSPNGLIATNSHVLQAAHQAEVKIGEKVYAGARLVRYIPQLDIAVLKVDAEGLQPLAIGDSSQLVSGQFVVALGNPLGFEQSVSSGIISAIRPGRQMDLIQLTVPLSPGSSGGPVFNEYGEVVGISTIASFLTAQNLNFAIPVKYLEKAVKQE